LNLRQIPSFPVPPLFSQDPQIFPFSPKPFPVQNFFLYAQDSLYSPLSLVPPSIKARKCFFSQSQIRLLNLSLPPQAGSFSYREFSRSFKGVNPTLFLRVFTLPKSSLSAFPKFQGLFLTGIQNTFWGLFPFFSPFFCGGPFSKNPPAFFDLPFPLLATCFLFPPRQHFLPLGRLGFSTRPVPGLPPPADPFFLKGSFLNGGLFEEQQDLAQRLPVIPPVESPISQVENPPPLRQAGQPLCDFVFFPPDFPQKYLFN